MSAQNDLINHILESLHAAIAEAEGREHEANHLHAQTKLRLLTMSDEEIWELARMISPPEEEAIKCTYETIKQSIREHSATASQWMKYLYRISK